MSDSNLKTSDEINPIPIENKIFLGKRKEQPPQNPYEKKKKINTISSMSCRPSQSRILDENNQKSIVAKINSTSVKLNNSKSLKTNSNKSQPSSISKQDFQNKFSKTLTHNIKTLFEQQRNLENNLKNLTQLSMDTKLNILSEVVKKNLELYELENLVKSLDESKKRNEEKLIRVSENKAKVIADREAWNFSLEKSCKAVDEINMVKLNLECKLKIKDEEIQIEILEVKINLLIFYIF